MTTIEIDANLAVALFRIKKNQLKMVERRGYDIELERNLLSTKPDDFVNSYIPFAKENKKSLREVLTRVYQNKAGEKLFIFYADSSPDTKQLSRNDLEPALKRMTTDKISNLVIITSKSLSSSASKKLKGLIAYNIQIFTEDDMGYDPTEHFMVPKHTPLTDDEQRLFLTENNISIDNMSIILTSDIIAKYYGLRAGRIVRIDRENMFPTMILKSVTYKQIKD